jgi:oligopeptide/dipeptide ABC transporter ATP-binding protein
MTDAAAPSAVRDVLRVDHLSVEYRLAGASIRAVSDVSLRVADGEAVGLVGESGSGKTTTALAISGLLPPNARRTDGKIYLRDTELPIDDERRIRKYRWREIAIVFQGAMNSLNPVHRIGDQIAEPLLVRLGWSRQRARARVNELLELVSIPTARSSSYPHELSGGMRQRAMIAMALVCEPSILIADEPTTALDVVTQAQILHLLNDLRSQLRLSLVLISHDLSVVAEACDRVVIMYAGRIIEEASAGKLFTAPLHPYTRLLLQSVPDPGSAARTIRTIPGAPPDMRQKVPGCPFHPRCPTAMEVCTRVMPPLQEIEGQTVACHLYPADNA